MNDLYDIFLLAAYKFPSMQNELRIKLNCLENTKPLQKAYSPVKMFLIFKFHSIMLLSCELYTQWADADHPSLTSFGDLVSFFPKLKQQGNDNKIREKTN